MKRFNRSQFEKLIEKAEQKLSSEKFANAVSYSGPAYTGGANKNAYLYENDYEAGILKRTIIANTYLWLDSHGDVHMPGVFAKSIKERKGRISHQADHQFLLSAKVGRVIDIYEENISWYSLGVNIAGHTKALFMESQIERKLNEKIFEEYFNDQIQQHSVSMGYVNIALAVNDDSYRDEYKLWQEVYPLLGNKARADELGYFYVVHEGRLNEISAVLMGSNELTPTLKQSIQKPSKLANAVANYYNPSAHTKQRVNANELIKFYNLNV